MWSGGQRNVWVWSDMGVRRGMSIDGKKSYLDYLRCIQIYIVVP